MNELLLTLPRLAGMRARAIELARALPDDLSDCRVNIDCSQNLSAAQGFVDELIKQLVEVRSCASVHVLNARQPLEQLARESCERRGYGELAGRCV
jgi:hypothetical protein